jgi:transcriptional regulator with XRE-family HTH domain
LVYNSEGEARLCGSERLAEIAAEVRGELTQEEVAERLGVSRQAISKAEDERVGSRMNGLRVRMISEIGGLHVDGPYWIVDERKGPSD